MSLKYFLNNNSLLQLLSFIMVISIFFSSPGYIVCGQDMCLIHPSAQHSTQNESLTGTPVEPIKARGMWNRIWKLSDYVGTCPVIMHINIIILFEWWQVAVVTHWNKINISIQVHLALFVSLAAYCERITSDWKLTLTGNIIFPLCDGYNRNSFLLFLCLMS